MIQLIAYESFVSVQEIQAGITRVLKRAERANKFIRVMRHDKPIGVLIPNKVWLEIIEPLRKQHKY